MPNPLRRPRSALPSESSLALLSSLPPRFSHHVSLALHPTRRLLQVRADRLLLFRRGASALSPTSPLHPSVLQLVVPLSDVHAAPASADPRVLRLRSLKLTFRDGGTAAELRALAAAATAAAARQPTFELDGPVLGRGATATVRAARMRSGGDAAAGEAAATVAVKLLPKSDLLARDDALGHLLAERAALHALAAARSPHAVRLLGAFTTDSHLALATELAAFGDVQDILPRLPRRHFPRRAARAIAAELVLAVGDAHRAGRLVRDVKLANTLLTASGRVRLADFGLAKAVPLAQPAATSSAAAAALPSVAPSRNASEITVTDLLSSLTDSEDGDDDDGKTASERADSHAPAAPLHAAQVQQQQNGDALLGPEPRFLQRAKSFVGTRRYMAPEVAALSGSGSRAARGGYGAAADVWALGVALCVLLTGKYPFSGEDGLAMAHAAATEEPQLDGVRAVDADAAELVAMMLHKDPLERADLAEVRRHPFFRDVRWQRLRERARADAPSEDVLDALREGDVNPVLELAKIVASSAGDVGTDGLERDISRLPHDGHMEGEDQTQMRCRDAIDSWQLVGWEYCGDSFQF